jgi:hypothetical protein
VKYPPGTQRLIYEAIKLEKEEDWSEPILYMHKHLSPKLFSLPLFKPVAKIKLFLGRQILREELLHLAPPNPKLHQRSEVLLTVFMVKITLFRNVTPRGLLRTTGLLYFRRICCLQDQARGTISYQA